MITLLLRQVVIYTIRLIGTGTGAVTITTNGAGGDITLDRFDNEFNGLLVSQSGANFSTAITNSTNLFIESASNDGAGSFVFKAPSFLLTSLGGVPVVGGADDDLTFDFDDNSYQLGSVAGNDISNNYIAAFFDLIQSENLTFTSTGSAQVGLKIFDTTEASGLLTIQADNIEVSESLVAGVNDLNTTTFEQNVLLSATDQGVGNGNISFDSNVDLINNDEIELRVSGDNTIRMPLWYNC